MQVIPLRPTTTRAVPVLTVTRCSRVHRPTMPSGSVSSSAIASEMVPAEETTTVVFPGPDRAAAADMAALVVVTYCANSSRPAQCPSAASS